MAGDRGPSPGSGSWTRASPISEHRRRLDVELVERGLVRSRSEAASLIAARRVLVNGAYPDKPARQVASRDAVEVVDDLPRFVGRGGEKLAAALSAFAIDPTDRYCLDAGSSTGGFTDCLLQRSANAVVAVDVGRGQLHPRLRDDHRVDVRERTDIRAVRRADLDPLPDLVVADLSFIGLDRVLPALLALTAEAGDLVLLVKPQFEAGAAEASRGRGVIKDPAVWRRVMIDVLEAVAERGAAMMGAMVSPLRGASGNVEFFVHVQNTAPRKPFAIEACVSALLDQVEV